MKRKHVIQVQFSLALPRIMFYAKNTTWRSSWLEKMQENLDKVKHLSKYIGEFWLVMFWLNWNYPKSPQQE